MLRLIIVAIITEKDITMKPNLSTHIRYFSFTLLLIPSLLLADAITKEPATTSATQGTESKAKPGFVQDYEDPIQFMTDFLDTAKKPDKPLKYWALQLVLLLRTNARLSGFCHKIKNIALSKELNADQRTKSINGAFIEAYTQQLFSEELSRFIFSKGLSKVKDAIQKRASVVA